MIADHPGFVAIVIVMILALGGIGLVRLLAWVEDRYDA